MPGNTILKGFRTKVVIHIIILTILFALSFLISISSPSYFAYLILAGGIIYTITNLFSLVNKTNRDVANFLLSIRFDDYESTYTSSSAYSDERKSLYKAFNIITDKFRDIRSEKEVQHQFLRAIVENIDTGLICFDGKGNTVLMNQALKNILHKSYFPSLKSVNQLSQELHDTFIRLQAGEQSLVKIEVSNSILQLAMVCTVLRFNKNELRLFVIQNINEQLEHQEIQSWQKLIRILTHEIMNSVSPVVSLAATTNDILEKSTGLMEPAKENIHQAIKAIQNRSKSLLGFTEKYRQLTRIPMPEFEKTNLNALLLELHVLYSPKFEEKRIEIDLQLPKRSIEIQADSNLLEQAFINLFKNALEAMEGHTNPTFEIRLYRDQDKVTIQFADNGSGIESSMLEKIFVPFFTTKKKGSGIGLSLCRQIILMHKGSIHVQSELGRGTVFTVRL